MIIAQAVGPTNQPISFTTGTGTAAQVIQNGSTPLVLTVGGQILNGRPFEVKVQGYVKAHGASQTMKLGLQAAKYTSGAFVGTQIYTAGTASGQMIAGQSYPFYLSATFFADNTSGILTGYASTCDGVTPTMNGSTVVSSLISGVSFGSNNVGANVTAPLAGAQTPALQFAITFTNSVSDTVEVVSITSFVALDGLQS